MKVCLSSPGISLMLFSLVTVAWATTLPPGSDDPQVNGTHTPSNSTTTSRDGNQLSPMTSIDSLTSSETTVSSATATQTTTKTPGKTTAIEPTISLMDHPVYRQLVEMGNHFLSEIKLVPVPANSTDFGQILSAVFQNVNVLQVVKRAFAQNDIRSVFPKPQSVNQRCYNEIVDVMDALIGEKQNASAMDYISPTWALKLADAIGKPPAGLLRRTLQWVGNYDECVDVHAKIPNGTYLGSRQTARSRPSEFRTRYCRAQILNPPPGVSINEVTGSHNWIPEHMPVIINWGLCLPESCDRLDVKNLLTKGTLAAFEIPLYDVVCFEREYDLSSDGWAVFAICLISFVGAVAVISTIMESAIFYGFIPLAQSWKTSNAANNCRIPEDVPSKKDHSHCDDNDIAKNEMKAGKPNDRTPLSTDRRPKDIFRDERMPPKPSNEHVADCKDRKSPLIIHLLEAFSIRRNGSKIMATSSSSDPNTLMCIQGIRVISIWWIILGHVYIMVNRNRYSYMFTSAYDLEKTISRLSFTFVAAGNLSVDTFFVIGGVLVMNMTLKELRRGKGQTVGFWVMFYVHRIWRLTPVYMMVLMTGTTLYDFLVDGPLKSRTYEMFDYCDSRWWSNLLYINNFYKSPRLCMMWSWYLAVDMQLFLISPIFIILIHRKYRTGLLVLVAMMILGSLTTFLLTLDEPGISNAAFLRGNNDFLKHVYLVPWPRIVVFAVGMLVGVILEDAPDRPYFSKLKAFLIWVSLTITAIFIIMIVHDELDSFDGHWSKGTMALYESMSRLIWGIYIAWIIYACHSGLGGIVTDLLTWTGFQPLARLTYTVYLVHPMIIGFYMFERNSTIDLHNTVMIYTFCGSLILSYLIAALYSLLFEAPLLTLEKIVLKKK